MGKLTTAALLSTVVAVLGARYLPSPYWMRALYAALAVAPLTALLGLGWSARDRAPSSWAHRAWVLLPAVAALAAAGVSFALGAGPGRLAQSHLTIDLSAWAVSAAGLSGALGAMGFGLAALASRRPWVAGAGAVVATLGLLALQPALGGLGHPRVGPVGVLVAALAVLVVRRLRGRSGEPTEDEEGPSSPDGPS